MMGRRKRIYVYRPVVFFVEACVRVKGTMIAITNRTAPIMLPKTIHRSLFRKFLVD